MTCDSSNGKVVGMEVWGAEGMTGRGEITRSSVGNAGRGRQLETTERC